MNESLPMTRVIVFFFNSLTALRGKTVAGVLCLGRLDSGDTSASLCSPSHSPALELSRDQMQALEVLSL